MFTILTVEIPVKELPVNLDVPKEHKSNNNVGEIDPVIDNSAPQRNICHTSSLDRYHKSVFV